MTSPTSPPAALPLKVFVSYSHRDEDFKDELVVHLANLKRQQKILAWHDRDIEAGSEWNTEIKQQLEAADIILLLISPRFLASDYCYDLEMQRAVERHEAGTARVIPIMLKPVDWQGTPFSKLQALPKDGKPITKWSDQDEAFLDVVKGIRRAVESLQAKKSAATAPSGSTVSPSSSPAASVAPAITAFQHQCLERQQTDLQEAWNLKREQLSRLRSAFVIEAGANTKFQLEKQIQTAETELAQLESQLAKIEQDLTNPNPPKK